MTSPSDPTRPAAPAPTDAPVERRSPAQLASDVIAQASNLVQKEIRLARTELSEGMTRIKTAIGEIVAGAVLLMVSLGILLSALVSGVARLLVGLFGDEEAGAARDVVAVEGLDEQQVALVTAMNRNMDAALDAARTLPTYESLAALIVGVIFAIIGGVLLRNGLNALDAGTLVPDRTMEQVRKDKDMVRDQT
jgi:hypothetical protein